LNTSFDTYDTRILAELQQDGRLSMAELGRRVHLSQPGVTERVRKLESAGVITGYGATVDFGKLGYGIRALLRLGRGEPGAVRARIEATPEVVNAYNVAGQDSWWLEIAVMDVAHLDDVVSAFALLTDVSTAVILRPVREHQAMLPARRDDVRSDPRPPLRKVSLA
jgi:Lrp/AsnC family leucine-responsive transcriptional regulator